tara:strand:- start:1401 stop:1610 length:210 start_codon:yes stop_codon:yes gene_type:complete
MKTVDEIQSDLDEVEFGVQDLASYVGDATTCETASDLIANLTEALKEANAIRASIGRALAVAHKVGVAS